MSSSGGLPTVSSRRLAVIVSVAAVFSSPILAEPAIEAGQAAITLEIHFPADDAVISDPICGAFIAGRAGTLVSRFDVAIVLDTSRSTIDPSGSDIDGDGIVGVRSATASGSIFDSASSDPDDSILAAEIAAARHLLEQFDPNTTRVALISFAGDPLRTGRESPARTIHPLTSDFSQIETALEMLRRENPRGATHMAAGLEQATEVLTSEADPESDANNRERIVFFFTDGQPTLPYGPDDERANNQAVLNAIQQASRAGIRIHSFAIGSEALEGPLAVVEMAARTGGYFVPVQRVGDLVNAVADVSVVRVVEVSVRNQTTGMNAPLLQIRPDGVWGAFVKLETGPNSIEIVARANDGTRSLRSVTVHNARHAVRSKVPSEIRDLHASLLRDCLDSAKQVRLELERELLRKLRLEIDRERAKARRRARDQRKRLELSIEE